LANKDAHLKRTWNRLKRRNNCQNVSRLSQAHHNIRRVNICKW